MNKKAKQDLKTLIDTEKELRAKFRKARKELEDLIQPITDHVRSCNMFWEKELPNTEEIVVLLNAEEKLKILRPLDEEVARCETYLPYGIDFEQCEVININVKND